MSYHRSHRPLGASYEEEMLELRRRELALQERQATTAASGARWNRVWQATQAIAIGVIPIATFLGVREWLFDARRRRRDVLP